MGRMSRGKGASYERRICTLYREAGHEVSRNSNQAHQDALGDDPKGDVLNQITVAGLRLHIQAKKDERKSIWNMLAQAEAEAPPGFVPTVHFSRNRSGDYVAVPLRFWLALLGNQREDSSGGKVKIAEPPSGAEELERRESLSPPERNATRRLNVDSSSGERVSFIVTTDMGTHGVYALDVEEALREAFSFEGGQVTVTPAEPPPCKACGRTDPWDCPTTLDECPLRASDAEGERWRDCPDAEVCQTCPCASEDDVCFPGERLRAELEAAHSERDRLKEALERVARADYAPSEGGLTAREMKGIARSALATPDPGESE